MYITLDNLLSYTLVICTIIALIVEIYGQRK